MHLRKLRLTDAPYMYEWMHDEYIVKNLKQNFLTKTMEDCEQFIINNSTNDNSVNKAIADDITDEYIGTVSLKNIHEEIAEFAICIRRSFMGKGIAFDAMNTIFEIGFCELNINEIYWCVSKENIRALKFYDKNNYKKIIIENSINACNHAKKWGGYSNRQIRSYIWYMVER